MTLSDEQKNSLLPWLRSDAHSETFFHIVEAIAFSDVCDAWEEAHAVFCPRVVTVDGVTHDVCSTHFKPGGRILNRPPRHNPTGVCPVPGCNCDVEYRAGQSCGCYACIGNLPTRPGSPLTMGMSVMIVCSTCGNKRCPHGTDHRNPCTGSNEPNQPGSRYGGLSVD